MSQIKLKHSGGNSVIIAAPDSNPASDRTLKLPSDGDGTILTTNSSVGKILQYKIFKKTNGISSTNTTQHEMTSDFRIEITPTSATSIIVINAELYLSTNQGGTSYTLRIVKNTASDFSGTLTNIMPPDIFSSNSDGHIVDYSTTPRMGSASMRVFETSGNTTTRTYGIYWRISTTSGGIVYLNRYSGTNYNGVSTFSVMEVAA